MPPYAQLPGVIILAHLSLLLGGIESKLQEYNGMLNVRTLDCESPDVSAVLRSESPAVIIVDAGEAYRCEKMSIANLLTWAPGARVIQVDPSSDHVSVFSRAELQVASTRDLVQAIQGFSEGHELR